MFSFIKTNVWNFATNFSCALWCSSTQWENWWIYIGQELLKREIQQLKEIWPYKMANFNFFCQMVLLWILWAKVPSPLISQDRWVYTVCNFHDFSTTHILREINFGDCKSAKYAILTHLEALNIVNLVNFSLQKL